MNKGGWKRGEMQKRVTGGMNLENYSVTEGACLGKVRTVKGSPE